MPKQIKNCKSRQKNGQCKVLKTRCSFLAISPLLSCPDANRVKNPKKGRKKR